MNILLVCAHPEKKSYTRALMDKAVKVIEETGNTCEISDLYAEGFNPVAGRHDFKTVANPDLFLYQKEQELAAASGAFSDEIAREQDRVKRSQMMIFFYPLWWGAPPAILKGWFERVLSYGFAYVDGTRFETGLFKGRKALSCVVTGGTAKRFTEGSTYGSIQQVLWPFDHCCLKYLGMDVAEPFVAYAVPRVDEAQRAQYFEDWGNHLRKAMQSEQAQIA